MALAAMAMLASCAPRPAPPALAPPPLPPRLPPPAPTLPPPADWRDGPLSPGDWSHSEESAIPRATFTSPGGPLFSLRCEPGRRITLFRLSGGGPITIVTSFGERTLTGSGNGDQVAATLAASDPLFDQMVFSRGRFLVRAVGGGELVLPSWPEPARVIEECRGQ